MTNLGNNFYPKLVQMASELQMSPLHIINIISSESGGNPAAHNPNGNASGLVQFMPKTLSILGFKGTPEDLRKMSGEQQLPLIKKLIEANMKFFGKPFSSPALFYVSNFFPVALKLPGVRAENPNTPIVEERPETVTDKTGKKFSKKYFDVGIKISPQTETAAYKANPLFHGTTPGAITYGDMLKQVEKNQNSPVYKSMADQLYKSTGHMETKPQADISFNKKLIDFINFQLQTISSYNKESKNVSVTNNFMIKIAAVDFESQLEFGRLLSTALEEVMDAKTDIFTDHKNVEIECQIFGPQEIAHKALDQFVGVFAETFEKRMEKISPVFVKTDILINKKSSYKQIDWKTADRNYRKFLLKILRG